MAKNSDIIRQCYVNLTDALEKYQDNWVCDETWVRVISAHYPDVINSIGFLRATFNCAISRHASQCGTQNALGMFIHQFQISCPYDSGQWRKVSFFIDKWLESPQQLLLDHMIARMCMLGPDRLGYQQWNAR